MSKTTKYALVISLLTYLLFYFRMLVPGQILYSGTDSSYFHHPRLFNLSANLKEGRFPFWSEKIFSGFPVYADIEGSYINPINVSFVYLFGPIWALKLQHLLFYFAGSLSLYFFLKNKGVSIVGYAVANLIYFFSFFMILHHQHINMVFTAFQLPTVIYFIDKYIRSKDLKHLFILSLVSAALFFYGSIQMLIIILMAMTLYLALNYSKSFTLKSALISYFMYFVLFVTLVLPLAVPAAHLYLQSARAQNPYSFLQGSFLPLNFLTILYPLLFTDGTEYIGLSIVNDFFKHEIYIYAGISSAILVVMGYFSKSKKFFANYLNLMIAGFLILGFARYIPLFNQISMPFLSSFRFWGRSVVLFNFAIACYAGIFLTTASSKLRFDKKKVQLLFSAAAIFVIFQLIYFNDRAFLLTARYLIDEVINGNFFDLAFFVWSTIALVVGLLVYFRPKKWAQIVVLIVALDLLYFGNSVAINAYRTIDGIIPTWEIPKECSMKRCANLEPVNVSNREMFFDTWSIFGYTEFVSENYTQAMKKAGIKKVRLSVYDEDLSESQVSANLKDLGAYASYSSDSFEVHNESFPFKNAAEYTNVEYGEGFLNFASDNTAPVKVKTLIRSYPGWQVFVNGEQVEFLESAGLFLEFDLALGQNIVEMKFVPIHFYQGLYLMFGLLGFEVLIYLKLKKLGN